MLYTAIQSNSVAKNILYMVVRAVLCWCMDAFFFFSLKVNKVFSVQLGMSQILP